jgi:hypothetical protein
MDARSTVAISSASILLHTHTHNNHLFTALCLHVYSIAAQLIALRGDFGLLFAPFRSLGIVPTFRTAPSHSSRPATQSSHLQCRAQTFLIAQGP